LTKQWANDGAYLPALKCRIQTLVTLADTKVNSRSRDKMYPFLQDTLRMCKLETLGSAEFNELYKFAKKFKLYDLVLDILALDVKKFIKIEGKPHDSNNAAMRLQLDSCAYNVTKNASPLTDKRFNSIKSVIYFQSAI
jgi:hypothetical protein